MEPRISVNGRITAPEEAVVPVLDRGFLYGDSVYEVLWWHRGAPIQLDEHLDRLERSAGRLYLTLGHDRAALVRAMLDAVAASGATATDEVYVRLIVTRGAGALGLAVDPAARPNVVVLVAAARRPDPAQTLALVVAERERTGRRALDPSAKTGNYMNNALALHEARAVGADDALLLNAAGLVTEATTANVYGVKAGALFTPAPEAGLLVGTTRRRVLTLASELGIPAVERDVLPDDLRGADEIFLSSSVRGLVPVRALDGRPLGLPAPGPVTRRLRAAFEQRADEEAAAWHLACDGPGA
jgi:branched-chain amino acid aminotransferase